MRKILTMVMVSFLLILTGCSSGTNESALSLAEDAKIEIVAQDNSIILDHEALLARPVVEIKTTNVSSKGDVTEVNATGISLKEILKENDMELSNVSSLNLVASDGYVMAVPYSEYEDSDVYLLFTYNDEVLKYPRSCIPDKRAMYWVKDLVKIELNFDEMTEDSVEVVNKIQFFRENIGSMKSVELNNNGSKVKSYSLMEYLEKYLEGNTPKAVKMIAKDGFTKTETIEVLIGNYVTLESEGDSPLYFSEEISQGMRVKELELIIAGETAIYFGDETDVASLFELVNMKDASEYGFVATDGFESVIPAEAMEFGKIFKDSEKGFVRAEFDGIDLSNIKGKGKVKNLSTIKALGEKTEAVDHKRSENTLISVQVGDKITDITEAEFLALPQMEQFLSRTNSKGVTVEGTYGGVHWSEIAKFVGVNNDVNVKAIASDGYEVDLSSEMLNDPTSLFGILENGVAIDSDGDGKVWFCASESFTANNWAKYVVTIVVQ